MLRYANFVKGAHWVGLSGLYLFALSGGLSTAGFNIGLYLMLIALLVQLPVEGRRILREPLLWSSLLFGLYLLYSTQSALAEFPDTSEFQIKRAWRWFMISGLYALVCAWWIGARSKHLGLLLGLAIAGFFLNFALETDWSQWLAYMNGSLRVDMDSLNPNKTGWYAAMICSGLIILGYRLAHPSNQTSLYIRLLYLGATFALGLFFGLFLLWSQSRAAWLAFGVVSILLFFALLLRGRSRGKFNLKYAGLVLGLFVLGLYLILRSDIIQERIATESDTIRSITTEQVSELPMNSVGVRLKLWKFGIEKFQQRPLLGWGLGSMNALASAHTSEIANHLHNFYLETLIGLGLIGSALLLLNIALVFRMAWEAYRNGTMDRDMGILLLALFVVTAVFQLFSTHLGTQGKFMLIFIGGLACAYRLRRDPGPADSAATQHKD
jgi:O-antigen ligase